jgi:hypothetical protein
MLEYARASAENLLAGVGVEATASTELAKHHGAVLAADGLQSTAWLCAETDRAPWIALELAKPVRARAVLLSHANANPLEIDHAGRATRVEVRVNDGRTVVAADMDADPMRKTEIPLAASTVLRSLEVRVVAFEGGTKHPKSTGLAEIELR